MPNFLNHIKTKFFATETRKRLAKNFFALSSGRILPHFVSIFLVVYAARILGPEGWGKYATAVAFTGLFSIIYDFGLASLIVREVARNKEKVNLYFCNFLLIKLILSLIGYILIVFFAYLMKYPVETIKVIHFVALSTIFVSIMVGVVEAIFQGIEKMEYVFCTSMFERCITVITGILVLKLGCGIFGFVKIALLCSIISLIFSIFIYMWKIAPIQLEFNLKFSFELFKMAIPFWFLFIMYIIISQTDIVMLSKMQSEKAVGIYTVSQRIIQILQYIPGVILGVLYPMMSRLFIESKSSLKSIYTQTLKYMLYLSILTAVLINLFADKIILLLYGNNYLDSVIVLRILILGCAIGFLNTVFVTMLNSINKTYIVGYILAFAALLNIGLNIFLIPPWGLNLSYVGSSISMLCSQILQFVLFFGYSKKFLYVNYG